MSKLLNKTYDRFLKDESVSEELAEKIKNAMILYGKYIHRNTRHKACDIITQYTLDQSRMVKIQNMTWSEVNERGA